MTPNQLCEVVNLLETVKRLADCIHYMRREQLESLATHLRAIPPVHNCDEGILYRGIAQYAEYMALDDP